MNIQPGGKKIPGKFWTILLNRPLTALACLAGWPDGTEQGKECALSAPNTTSLDLPKGVPCSFLNVLLQGTPGSRLLSSGQQR